MEKWGPGPTTSTNYQPWESATLEMELLASDKFWENSSNWHLTAIDRCPRKSPQPSSYKVLTRRICEHNRWLLVATKFGLIFCITLDKWNRLNVVSIVEIHVFLKLWSLLYLKFTNFFFSALRVLIYYTLNRFLYFTFQCVWKHSLSPFFPLLCHFLIFFSLCSLLPFTNPFLCSTYIDLISIMI